MVMVMFCFCRLGVEQEKAREMYSEILSSYLKKFWAVRAIVGKNHLSSKNWLFGSTLTNFQKQISKFRHFRNSGDRKYNFWQWPFLKVCQHVSNVLLSRVCMKIRSAVIILPSFKCGWLAQESDITEMLSDIRTGSHILRIPG